MIERRPFEVREALPTEYAEIGRVTQAAWQEFARPNDTLWDAYYRLLGDVAGRAARTLVLAAACGAGVIGTATVELEATIEEEGTLAPGQANFRMLAVDPRRRGLGIGHRLVAECLERARAAGKRVASLHTLEQMTAAAEIYREFGFERNAAADVRLSPDTTLLAYRLEL